MSKRKFPEDDGGKFKSEFGKGHTLDSDEEDQDEATEKVNRLDENDIEGEEDGTSRIDDDEVKFTPFNMKEELEEGHFDADGHYQWKKDKEIKDNWLDNIDWVKIKKDSNYKEKYNAAGLPDSEAESSTDEEEDAQVQAFDLTATYKNILEMMNPRETVKKSLQRLGGTGGKKISSVERWKRKKAGIVDNGPELVGKMTGYCDSILTRTGNMDIYEETFESIQSKVKGLEAKHAKANPAMAVDLDMYADDFDCKEQAKLTDQPSTSTSQGVDAKDESQSEILMWEYKVKQEDENILGPYTSEQMQKFVDEGKFKDPVFVRKVKDAERDAKFYTSARIDFDLYI